MAMAWVMVASGVWESPAPHKSKGSFYLGRSFSFLHMHFGLSGSSLSLQDLNSQRRSLHVWWSRVRLLCS